MYIIKRFGKYRNITSIIKINVHFYFEFLTLEYVCVKCVKRESCGIRDRNRLFEKEYEVLGQNEIEGELSRGLRVTIFFLQVPWDFKYTTLGLDVIPP